MDRLDQITVAAVAILIAAGVAATSEELAAVSALRAEAPSAEPPDGRRVIPIEPEITPIRALLESGAVEQAEVLASGLSRRFPLAAAPHLLVGDAQLRRDHPIEAALAYRRAVLRDPDILDKKTPQYQGRKISRVVEEALAVLADRSDGDGSETRRLERQLRAMQRRIAGSCG